MRVYHFLPAKHALDDIQKRRIKIAEIDQLNDPFELWSVYQKDPSLRDALRRQKREMAQRFGLLCFSRRWHNPVLWSHYGDKHRGMCLGLDVDKRGLGPVRYVTRRPRLRIPPSLEDAKQLLFTKFRDWKYEHELRSWIQLDERDPKTKFYFYSFNESVALREVIVGPLCNIEKATIEKALEGYTERMRIIKARLAFRTFRVVRNRKGFVPLSTGKT